MIKQKRKSNSVELTFEQTRNVYTAIRVKKEINFAFKTEKNLY